MLADLRAILGEGAAVVRILRDDSPGRFGHVLVSGMLAEQLARELGRGAEPGSVVVGQSARLSGAEAAVHVLAGDHDDADVAFVRSADHAGVPVVLVQVWPQPDWTPPYVLSPFVVECRPGEGFPVSEIAGRVVEAVESASGLAARVPALRAPFERRAVRAAVVRAALAGALGARRLGTRALLTREQARLLARLPSEGDRAAAELPAPVLAGVTAALFVAGLGLRQVARTARSVAPGPLADAAVAAGGTWLLGEAAKALRSRLS